MAITGIALAGNQGMHSSSRPEFTYQVTCTLDASYPDGGYTAFVAGLQAAIPALAGMTIVDIRASGPCGGYKPIWIRTTDVLQIWRYPESLGPAVQCTAATNLTGVVCELVLKAI